MLSIFHVPIGHLYIFFGKMSIQLFCPFFNWVGFFFYIELYELFIWRRRWHPTPVLLPGGSHRWRSLVGCNPWGCWKLDMTERLHFHFSPSCIGEGNGNPLQCSCLGNPRDGGAWWAAVYGSHRVGHD